MRHVVVWLALLATACKSEQSSGPVKLLVDDAKVVLPQIRAAIASGKLSDAPPCSRVLANLDDLEADGKHAALVEDIRQVCDHDIHIAKMKIAVEAAEAARKAQPTEKVLRECFSGELSMAKKRLEAAKRLDAPAEALLARFATACPDDPP